MEVRVKLQPTCCDSESSCAVYGAVRVGGSAAEQTSILWKGLSYDQGADLL